MKLAQATLAVRTSGAGPREITVEVEQELERTGLANGVVTIFCQHTSCSLVLMENADPSAWADMQNWFNWLVREDDSHFNHTSEGPDDMPSHIKMALTRTSETIPFKSGQLALGTWQGVFLWEHRSAPHSRNLFLTFIGTVG